jgi:hypothetical protein
VTRILGGDSVLVVPERKEGATAAPERRLFLASVRGPKVKEQAYYAHEAKEVCHYINLGA